MNLKKNYYFHISFNHKLKSFLIWIELTIYLKNGEIEYKLVWQIFSIPKICKIKYITKM